MPTKAYDAFSSEYDRFVNWEERFNTEMPFLLSKLEMLKTESKQPIRVLDAACGTGMHAIYLAQKGYRTAGTDISIEMIKQAQANARTANASAVFKTAGFGEITDKLYRSPLLPFDTVLCLGNSLPHVLTTGALQTALKDIATCLRPSGVLVIQNRNFDLVMSEKQRWLGTQSHTERDNDWLFLRFYDFDSDGLITFNIVRLHRKGHEPWQENISTVRLFPIKKKMLVELLQETGFTDIHAYGAMAAQPFNPQSSGNLVITAIRV